MLKLNNDVVNTVPRSTFTGPDSVNQTTLSPAMFQYKGPAAAAAASSSPKTLSSSRKGISYTTKESGPSDDGRIDTTPMEIDRNTFSELPLEIQEELSRHHHLVFVDRDPTGTSNSNSNAQGSGYEGDGQYNDVTLAQHALPLRSRLDPLEPAALSTLEMTDTSKAYPETGQGDHDYASKAQADWLPMQPGTLPPEIQAEIEQEYTHMMENKGLIQKLSLPEPNSAVTSGGQPVSLGPQGSNRAPRKGQIRELSSGQGQTGESGREKDVASVNAAGHSRATAQDETDEGHKESPGTEDLQEGIEPLRSSSADICTTADIPELDADFLAALPPDIRAEIETAHNLEMIKHRQKHATAANIRQVAAGYEVGSTTVPDRLVPERPTLMGLRDVGELRKMLTEWVRSTLLQQDTPTAEDDTDNDRGGSGTATRLIIYDEGPNPEDVKSFSDFIARVIFMERDLERVRVLLRYLQRRIEENEKSASPEHPAPKHVRVMVSWREALESITSTARQQILELYGGTLVLD
ncbi:hypothetical protein BGZ99_003760 [Dissophora globulifera]|uniref:DNA repair protein Rev1 C-terminal domain-containing protein n=1 Tax=Dissophora globulifera TaxID=979702 RepID=A0A9P6RP56_9FUNG|nr:hypothetical protein BGZ99_003760 [Dissophora globulifera]